MDFDGTICIEYANVAQEEVFLTKVPNDSLVWGCLPVCSEGGMKHVQIRDLWGSRTERPLACVIN